METRAQDMLMELRIGYRPTGSTVGGSGTPHRYTEFDGVEEYLYATDGTEITAAVLEGKEESSIWDMACRNTDRAARIIPMRSVLGLPADPDEPPMVVVSTRESYRGAAAIGGTEIRDKLRVIFGDKAFVLPSSIHEVIVVAYDPAAYEDYCNMVRDINRAEVAADDVLADEAYVLHLAPETETAETETDDEISDDEWIPEF